IDHASSAASIYSILKLTPSVNEYQQNIGPGTPTLTVRGVRMSQLAQTLDGIPMISLLHGGQGAYINNQDNNVGSLVSMGQIEGIHVYPGVAPPDRGGFATVGGTVSYKTKQPTKKFYVDLFSKIGSFSTDTYGFQVNTGSIPDTGGLKILARLSRTTTDGYIQHTPAKYTDFLFSAIKPYDYGLSKVFATIIYNRGSGYMLTETTPIPQLDKYGIFYNYPLTEASNHQNNRFLTAILGDQTYLNRYIVLSGKVFYIHKDNRFEGYTDPQYINETYPYQVNFNSPYFAYGPIGQEYGNNNNFTYNPVQSFGSYHAGEAAELQVNHTRTIGFVPKINIFLPLNTITIGGLIANESTGNNNATYAYGTLNMPEEAGYNALTYGNIARRTVFSGFIQDKLSLFNNSLHIEPGVTITGVNTTNYVPYNIYGTPPHPYTLSNYSKDILPYFGLSYDVTKHIIAYASYGKGARFAPVQDYVLGSSGSTTVAPGPETVNAYEAGARYVSKRLYLNVDGFLQNMHGMFSFYTDYLTNFSLYSNIGEEQMKGIEISGKYILTHRWSLFASGSYTDAKYMNSFSASDTPFEGQYGYVFAGDPLAAVPNWLANLGVNFKTHRLFLQIYGSYTGSQPTTYDLPPTEPELVLQDATVPTESVKVSPYFLVNLNASYKLPIEVPHVRYIKATLSIDNLFDNHYYVHTAQVYKQYRFTAVGNQYNSAYPGMPRFIEVGISGRFY
ncbi:TonB-dependent receptor, partial [Acidithiobacillus sp. VAN18-4]|nr:TonB-dependent receptor [Acidithiobacillus sp. VAN18-4]